MKQSFEEHSLTIGFLKHIFQDQIELGLDYIQLLVTNPTQRLPVLCLTSEQNGTGKTTFAKWLKSLFPKDVAFVNSSNLEDDFNYNWAGKLVVVCDEVSLRITTIEKIKVCVSADRIVINRAGLHPVERNCSTKFILTTNSRKNLEVLDRRSWIIDTKPFSNYIYGFQFWFEDERERFLEYISTRTLSTVCQGNLWFDIKTLSQAKVV